MRPCKKGMAGHRTGNASQENLAGDTRWVNLNSAFILIHDTDSLELDLLTDIVTSLEIDATTNLSMDPLEESGQVEENILAPRYVHGDRIASGE